MSVTDSKQDAPAESIEIWRSIPGYPPYEASNMGGIRNRRGVLGQRYDEDGYKRVRLVVDGGRRVRRGVHTLVLLAFVGVPPDGHQARHKRKDSKDDNRLVNLHWGTARDNQRDRASHGTANCGENHNKAKLTYKQAEEIRELRKTMSTKAISEQYGVHQRTIQRLIAGTTWSNPPENGRDKKKAALTKEQVIEIRRLRSTGLSYRKISPMFGVTRQAIMRICQMKCHKKVS